MAQLSMTEVWDDTRLFVLRERALLLPIALATFGLGTLILAVAVPEHPPGTRVEPGPWMAWMIPTMFLMMVGNLAMSLIALRPGSSVAETLQGALRLAPRAIGLGLVLVAAIVLFLLTIGIVIALLKFDQGSATVLGSVIFLPLVVWLSVKLAVLWPTLADRQGSIQDTVKGAIALTRGHGFRIFGLMLINFSLYVLLSAVIELAAGSVLLILARLLGVEALGPVLVAILMAAFSAIYVAFWSVFLAKLYQRLAR